ncbi:MAG: anti-sigma factor [Solirubrobacteraceae bacterium]
MSSEEPRTPPQDCDGNAASYVLGALPDNELAAFRVHLASCAVCREEVAALQVVVDALPAMAPHVSAPPALKKRIMTSVGEDLPAAARTTSARAGRRFAMPSLALRPVMGLGAAALVVAAIAIALLSGGSSSPSTRVIHAQVLAPHASATLQVSDGHAELNIAGMPQTAPNRVYEVWVKRVGAPQPTNALFTVTTKGRATVGVPGSVSGVKEILVTSEPIGGSLAPTREPVIIASLS